jgi:hypothetical protein
MYIYRCSKTHHFETQGASGSPSFPTSLIALAETFLSRSVKLQRWRTVSGSNQRRKALETPSRSLNPIIGNGRGTQNAHRIYGVPQTTDCGPNDMCVKLSANAELIPWQASPSPIFRLLSQP